MGNLIDIRFFFKQTMILQSIWPGMFQQHQLHFWPDIHIILITVSGSEWWREHCWFIASSHQHRWAWGGILCLAWMGGVHYALLGGRVHYYARHSPLGIGMPSGSPPLPAMTTWPHTKCNQPYWCSDGNFMRRINEHRLGMVVLEQRQLITL